jgi:hypothetical protein
MKWSVRNKDTRPKWRIAAEAFAAAGLILLSSVAGLHAAQTGVSAPTNIGASVEPLGTTAPNQITGILKRIDGPALTITTRKGASIFIDDAKAVQAFRASPLVVGNAFTFGGTYDPRGKLLATIILRAKSSTSTWPKDR